MLFGIEIKPVKVIRVGNKVFLDTADGMKLADGQVVEEQKIIPGTPNSYAQLREPEVRPGIGLKIKVDGRIFLV